VLENLLTSFLVAIVVSLAVQLYGTVVRYSCRTVVVPPATTKKGSEDKKRRAEENSPSSTIKKRSEDKNQRRAEENSPSSTTKKGSEDKNQRRAEGNSPSSTTKKGSEDKNQRRAKEGRNSQSSTTKRESDETHQRLLRNWLIAKWIIGICIFIAVGCVVGLIVVGSSKYQCPNCPIVNVTHGTPTTIKPTTVPPNIKKEGMQTKK
jgi:hypothetical protein